MQFNEKHIKHFREWLSSNLGQMLILEETKIIEQFVQTFFGFYLVFLGEAAFLQCINNSKIPNRFWLDLNAYLRKDSISVIGRQDKLPIISDEIDLVYLAHCLELCRNPHEVLRETYRTLKPEGHIIISGFNPWSIWGLWRYAVRYVKRSPWDGRLISIGRLKDWLALLGFDIVQIKMCVFRPPIQSTSFMGKLKFIEKIGQFIWPVFGANYVVLARKRVVTLTPIRPKFRKPRLVDTRWVEPVTRMDSME